jgi:large subunit ribosomal protein L25
MSQRHQATLAAEPRTVLGTRAARKLRAAGKIPASLQAEGSDLHVDLAIDAAEFLTSRRKHQHVYELVLGERRETAIVRELVWDVFGEHVVHIEFRRVDLTKKTEVEVELVFTGHPKGVLNHLVTHVTVRALPTDIPDELEVSVADLEPGTTVTADKIKVPAAVELVTPSATPVARISQIKIEILEPTPAAAVEGAAAPGTAAAAAGGAPAAAGAAPGAAPAADKAKPGAEAKPEKGGKGGKKE